MTNKTTVSSYSSTCANFYDDPQNKNFVYGQLTIDFLEQVNIEQSEKVILDIGCGTGFGFDVLRSVFEQEGKTGIGIEPAEGMLNLAIQKFRGNDRFSFMNGSFEDISLEDKSVDKIISTLALHWATSIDVAARNLYRVLRDGGSVDILMIAKDDGALFKGQVVQAMKKHLTFSQIMHAASLARRVTADQLCEIFQNAFGENYIVKIHNAKRIIYGTFEEHMKWWTARSSAIIADIQNTEVFMNDLQTELSKIEDVRGIPFDLSCLFLNVKGR